MSEQPAAMKPRNDAYDAANREEAQCIHHVDEDFAARGFLDPPWMRNQRRAQARDGGMQSRVASNHYAYIQDSQAAQESLRAGVNAGVQLEQALMAMFSQREQMQL